MELSRAAEPPSQPSWARSHAAGLLAFALGLAALVVTALVHLSGDGEITKIPDVRMTIPFLASAIIAVVVAFVRREGAYPLPIAGLALALAAVVLGWALILGAIAIVTVIAILILSEIM